MDLYDCEVTDRGLTYLQRLPELQSLTLSYVPITDAGMSALAGHPSLEEIVVYLITIPQDSSPSVPILIMARTRNLARTPG